MVGVCGNPARRRLYRLSAANFAAIGSHGAIECHILWFKRSDRETATNQ
jgi:hypothetical protein